MNPQFHSFRKVISQPLKFRWFMISKLPMGFISGLKLEALDPSAATVSVRFNRLNQNPFRSIYFAVLSMAAELSTGVQAFAQVYGRKPAVSMLVVKMNAEFYKKAVGTIRFTCTDGVLIEEAIEKSIATKEGVTVDCTSVGFNEAHEPVARFIFTWSFKAKS